MRRGCRNACSNRSKLYLRFRGLDLRQSHHLPLTKILTSQAGAGNCIVSGLVSMGCWSKRSRKQMADGKPRGGATSLMSANAAIVRGRLVAATALLYLRDKGWVAQLQ